MFLDSYLVTCSYRLQKVSSMGVRISKNAKAMQKDLNLMVIAVVEAEARRELFSLNFPSMYFSTIVIVKVKVKVN